MKKFTLLVLFFSIRIFICAQPVNLDWVAPIVGFQTAYTEALAVDGAGNVYHTGRFSGSIDFDPGPGVYYLHSTAQLDMYVTSVDSSGNFRWARRIGGYENQWGMSIAIDGDADVIISGVFNDTIDFDPGPGTYYMGQPGPMVHEHAFILKLDSSGIFLWAKEFQGMGNPGAAYGSSVVCDQSDNIFMNVNYADTMIIDPNGINDTLFPGSSNYNACILKLTAAGNIVWYETFQGGYTELFSLALDVNANIYGTGKFSGTVDFDPGTGTSNLASINSQFDAFICRLDSSGNFAWAKQVGGPAPDRGTAIKIDPSGNVLTTGDFMVSGDFDPGPATYSFTASGTYDTYYLKLDSLGSFIWAQRLGGNANAYMHSFGIATDSDGSMYVTGTFDYQMGGYDFDPGAGVFMMSAASYAGYILKLDSAGLFHFAAQISGGAASNAAPVAIALDGNRNIYVGGLFAGQVDFDPSPLVNSTNPIGQYGGFVCKLHQDYLSSVVQTTAENQINVFPNPNNGTFTLQLTHSDADVMIYDALGRLVSAQNVNSSSVQIVIAEPGTYLITVITEDGQQTSQRVVVTE